MIILAVGLGLTGWLIFGADIIAPWISLNAPQLAKFSLTSKFFWLIVIATTGGLILSFTKLKNMKVQEHLKLVLFFYILLPPLE